MGFIVEERSSDSPYVETVIRGRTACDGSAIRPAVCQWHMALVRYQDVRRVVVSGPWTRAGPLAYKEGAELLWIKFRLGSFMPAWPTRQFLDSETSLPEAACASFWLNGSTWQFPDYENVETFVSWLARDGTLARDPTVCAALHDETPAWSERTVRDHFLRVTGMTRRHIQQIERAQRAAALLDRGVSIADTVYQAGYFDQPHLTRSLKRWLGHTPAQMARACISE